MFRQSLTLIIIALFCFTLGITGCDSGGGGGPTGGGGNTGTISGQITDGQSGNGISNATVLSDDGESTTTDNDGNFSFDCEAGERTITINANRFLSISRKVQVTANRSYTLNFSLESAGTDADHDSWFVGLWDLTRMTEDSQEVPANERPNMTLTINADGTGMAVIDGEEDGFNWSTSGGKIILTGTDGADGEFEYSTSGNTFTTSMTEDGVEMGFTFTRRLVVVESGTVSGRVTDSETSNGISGATITSDDGRTTVTDNSGNYSFEVDAGQRTISASANNYTPDSKSTQVSVNGSQTVNFELDPIGGGGETGTVSGTVRDSVTYNRLSGATVTSDDGQSTSTDSSGHYSFQVGAGSRTIMANASGYRAGSRNVNVTDGGSHTADFYLIPGSSGETGTVSGRVRDSETNRGIMGATVTSDDGRSTSTDSSGYYSFEVDAGHRTITATASGYNSQSEEIDVSDGGSHTRNIFLTPSGGGQGIIGTWDLFRAYVDSVEFQAEGETFVFNNGGEGVNISDGGTTLLSWSIVGDQLHLLFHFDGGDGLGIFAFTVDETTLHLGMVIEDVSRIWVYRRR